MFTNPFKSFVLIPQIVHTQIHNYLLLYLLHFNHYLKIKYQKYLNLFVIFLLSLSLGYTGVFLIKTTFSSSSSLSSSQFSFQFWFLLFSLNNFVCSSSSCSSYWTTTVFTDGLSLHHNEFLQMDFLGKFLSFSSFF